MQFINLAGYRFVALDGLDARKAAFREKCANLALKGTVLLSPEGINLFAAGSEDSCAAFVEFVRADPSFADLRFKRSVSSFLPFDRMLVKIKKEIITLRSPGPDPATQRAAEVSAAELKGWLDEGRDVVLIDARNEFEVAAGSFKDAIDLKLKSFGEFPAAVDRLDPALKDKTIVTFCTGGIRCEKAAPVMTGKGFKNVFQLEGGILQYFEDCGDAHFAGRCFVFDHRVELDGNLATAVTGAR